MVLLLESGFIAHIELGFLLQVSQFNLAALVIGQQFHNVHITAECFAQGSVSRLAWFIPAITRCGFVVQFAHQTNTAQVVVECLC